MKRIGIDLGTTNTVAAVDDHALTFGAEDGARLPSVVAFMPNGTIQTGEVARRRRSIDGGNTCFSSKRIIGRRFDDSVTRTFCERYPFEIVETEDGLPAYSTRAGLKTPSEIAAILLSTISEQLKDIAGEIDLLITVPSGFRDPQREATLEAADRAGFGAANLIDEPLSTAWAYVGSPDVGENIVVYDLGGGTFDVSVVQCTGSMPRLLSHGSDLYLGGDDVDQCIASWIREEVLKQANWDLGNYSEVLVRVLAEAEHAKIRLSRQDETLVDLSQIDPECPLAGEGLVLQRKMMDSLSHDLVRRTFITCDRVMAESGLRAQQIDTVLLAGGGTHLQLVQDGVEAYFGRVGLIDIEPTEVVARGASLAEI